MIIHKEMIQTTAGYGDKYKDRFQDTHGCLDMLFSPPVQKVIEITTLVPGSIHHSIHDGCGGAVCVK